MYNFQQSLTEHNCPKKNNSKVRFSLIMHGKICPFCKQEMNISPQQLGGKIGAHNKKHQHTELELQEIAEQKARDENGNN
jgi:hypothetical protein